MEKFGIKNLSINKEKLLKLAGDRLKLKKEKSLEKAGLVIKDLRENRNWSWTKDIEYRNQNNLDDTALFYRGTEVTYGELLYEHRIAYAKSLKKLGINKGDIVPICMPHETPEFVYLLNALNYIGARPYIFGGDFEKDQIMGILNNERCTDKVMFIEDNQYELIEDLFKDAKQQSIVMTSLSNSLKDGIDPYAELDKPYEHLFTDHTEDFKKKNQKIISVKDFVEFGKDYQGQIEEEVGLDDPFTITFSSGTTSKYPKPIEHANRSFNVVTRFHDKEINHTPSLKRFRMQATIPTFSSTALISGISDALTQGCTLALEPIYDENFVIEGLLINKPNYLDLTRSFLLKMSKDVLYNQKYRNVKLPFLTFVFSVGEPTEISEENLINKALQKAEAGKDIFKALHRIVKVSVAGGDCEHGGIFYKLFRSYSNKNPIHKIKKEPAGLGTFDMVDVSILDENGNHLGPYQMGKVVATSELNMIGYMDNPEATEDFFIKDANGKVYGDCKVDGYQDLFGRTHLKGRQENMVSTFNITDAALNAKSQVLSAETIPVDDMFVVHIEFLPTVDPLTINELLNKINNSCINELGEELASKVVFRVHDSNESFALTHSGKRDKLSLINEGLSDKCVKPVYINGEIDIVSANEYINKSLEKKVSHIL